MKLPLFGRRWPQWGVGVGRGHPGASKGRGGRGAVRFGLAQKPECRPERNGQRPLCCFATLPLAPSASILPAAPHRAPGPANGNGPLEPPSADERRCDGRSLGGRARGRKKARARSVEWSGGSRGPHRRLFSRIKYPVALWSARTGLVGGKIHSAITVSKVLLPLAPLDENTLTLRSWLHVCRSLRFRLL